MPYNTSDVLSNDQINFRPSAMNNTKFFYLAFSKFWSWLCKSVFCLGAGTCRLLSPLCKLGDIGVAPFGLKPWPTAAGLTDGTEMVWDTWELWTFLPWGSRVVSLDRGLWGLSCLGLLAPHGDGLRLFCREVLGIIRSWKRASAGLLLRGERAFAGLGLRDLGRRRTWVLLSSSELESELSEAELGSEPGKEIWAKEKRWTEIHIGRCKSTLTGSYRTI